MLNYAGEAGKGRWRIYSYFVAELPADMVTADGRTRLQSAHLWHAATEWRYLRRVYNGRLVLIHAGATTPLTGGMIWV